MDNYTGHALDSPSSIDRSEFYLGILGVLSVVYLLQTLVASSHSFKAPFVGFRSWLEPKWLVGLRFSQGALTQVNEGYAKVCTQ